MPVEANKAVVRRYFDAVNRGDCAAILALTSDDFMFTTMARAPAHLQIEWDREAFSQVPPAMSALMKAPIRLDVVGMIGEGDSVAVEAETDGEMRNGLRYNNAYHFVFELAHGKLRRVREYSCSHLAQLCFGEFATSNSSQS